jgi:glycosyltransferase involved in cell wall biosynthesis
MRGIIMNLSLVVPCYNEEGNVEKFFSEVLSIKTATYIIVSGCLSYN